MDRLDAVAATRHLPKLDRFGGSHMKIDVQKLDVKLADKGASQECPVCGGIHWTADGTPAAVHAIDPDEGEVNLGTAVPAAIFVCSNCGFIRLHALDVVLGRDD
jgi:predicted RNA-binding Zn-ribbon protein involved in translation (DUF1610 family)